MSLNVWGVWGGRGARGAGPARDARGTGYGARMSMIDIAGFNERQVITPPDATDPAWSPLLS